MTRKLGMLLCPLVVAGVCVANQSHATIIYGDSYAEERLKVKAAYEICAKRISGYGLWEFGSLESSSSTKVSIMYGKGGSYTSPVVKEDASDGRTGSSSVIYWQTDASGAFYNGTAGGFTITCAEDPCATLFHELTHAKNASVGSDYKSTKCTPPGGIDTAEARACWAENRYRAAAGLCIRSYYDGLEIPPSSTACETPSPRPLSADLGVTPYVRALLDPHFETIDGVNYAFNGIGEYVLSKSTVDALEIQVRLQPPWPADDHITSISSVAAKVGGDTVEVRGRWSFAPTLRVNGVQTPVPAGGTTLPAGGMIVGLADGSLDITWTDGSALHVQPFGIYGLNLLFKPAAARAGLIEGLSGNYDGIASNDLRIRGGSLLPYPASSSDFYPAFSNSWRVSTSLFTYDAGESSATFTDLARPTSSSPPTISAADDAIAQSICSSSGVTEPKLLSYCAYDVALTGQPALAFAAKAIQDDLPRRIAVAGAVSSVSFWAEAGRRLFIEVPKATFADRCGAIAVYGPTGALLPAVGLSTASGCVVSAKGYWDTQVLPATGLYSLRIDPGTSSGYADVRLSSPIDQSAATTIDAAPVGATIAMPGAVSRLTFPGVSGDTVKIDGTSTFTDKCGLFRLLGPSGTEAFPGKSGCVIGGVAVFNSGGTTSDPLLLPATGTYTILLDPDGPTLGNVKLRVHH